MVELIVVVVLVLGASATCSLFEAVLYSVPASRIAQLEQERRPSGRVLKQMRQQVDRPIAAILSLNTVANTGGGAVAGALAVNAYGQDRIWVFSIAFTLAILFVSEVLPKTVGVVYARSLAPFIARPLAWLVVLFRPLIVLTQFATRLIRRPQQDEGVSDEELLTMVGLGLRSGDLRPHEARVIRNVLLLEERKVRDVMTPRPVVFTLAADISANDAAAKEGLDKHSRVPVHAPGNPDDLIGVVHKVDILKAVARDQFDTPVKSLMRPIDVAVEAVSLDEVLTIFLERREHMLAVIDEFGGFSGIITLEDVLEELIGREIVDEFDQVADLRAFARRRRLAEMEQQRERK